MKLPYLRYSDRITKSAQMQFGGLNHNPGATDGELWDMKNMTAMDYPLLATRPRRRVGRTLTKGNGIYSWDGLCWVDGTQFFYKGEAVGEVADGLKSFAAMGAYIIILPDKAYYNTLTGEFGNLESSWAGAELTFIDGLLYEEDAAANCIQAEGVDWEEYFRAGDAVTIAGCTAHTENNKTPIIREIDGDKLYFYENVFVLDGDAADEPYTESGALSITRAVPDMDFICSNDNRLWGCRGDEIFCSKLGDIFNFNVFDGLDSDSYSVQTGTPGDFTACVSYMGYPIFFKENRIFKVYGSYPSNYEVMGSATLGVAPGSEKSLAVAGETLFYLSRAGICAYTGGIPAPVGSAMGRERFKDAVAGSDGLRYYVSLTDETGRHRLYVYDSQKGIWHIEDDSDAVGFAWHENLYMLTSDGRLQVLGNILGEPADTYEEEAFDWMAEFSDFVEMNPNAKGVGKLQIRLELAAGAACRVEMLFDSVGDWLQVAEIEATEKRSLYLPIIPRRVDHYRLRLTGTGDVKVYSIAREYYSGSANKTKH